MLTPTPTPPQLIRG